MPNLSKEDLIELIELKKKTKFPGKDNHRDRDAYNRKLHEAAKNALETAPHLLSDLKEFKTHINHFIEDQI